MKFASLFTGFGAVLGTVRASKAVTADANKDVTGFRNISLTGAMRSSGATSGVGYATGAGGAVTQLTNKQTGVTLNTITGQITTHNESLAAAAETSFTVTNSAVGADDVVAISIKSGATAGAYNVQVDAVAAGSFRVSIGNMSAGALGEALVLNYAVLKGAAA